MNLLVFLFLCSVSIIVGVGLLHLLGFKDHEDPVFIASPVISLSLWSLILGIGVTLYIPTHILTYLTWIVNLTLCLVAFKFFHLKKILLTGLGLSGIALIISLPYLLHNFANYTGSPSPDGWSYIAFAQYLWAYPRCLEGGLAPLYQYSSHLCQTRFITGSLLGLFSPLAGNPGDTQAASGFFFPWAFFVYASACRFFIRQHFSKILTWSYLIICVVSGWLLTIMKFNNFDQSLMIGFLPLIAGIIENMDFAKIRWVVLLAVILSSCIYIYPELTPFIFIGSFLLLIIQISQRKIRIITLWRLGLMFVLIFGLLISANASNWFNFLLSQGSSLQSTNRPGESIAGELLDNRYSFTGVWGLGEPLNANGQSTIVFLDWMRYVISAVFTFVAIVGLVRLVKNKTWGLFTLLIFLGSFFMYFLIVQKYSYAAYKIISILWWIIAYMLILAVQWLERLNSLEKHSQRGNIIQGKKYFQIKLVDIQGSFLLLVLIMATINIYRIIQFDKIITIPDIAPYKELTMVETIVNHSPIGISIEDPIASIWAMYYLRNSVISFLAYQSYPSQSHLLTLMGRSQQVNSNQIRYILTDTGSLYGSDNAKEVWKNQIYSLWKIDSLDLAYISEINNPNGLDMVGDKKFYWLGSKGCEIKVMSFSSGSVVLTGAFTPGPSLPEYENRTLELKSIEKKEFLSFIIKPGINKLEFPVKKGINEIIFTVKDRPSKYSLPNGDPRILLLGVQDIKMNFLIRTDDNR